MFTSPPSSCFYFCCFIVDVWRVRVPSRPPPNCSLRIIVRHRTGPPRLLSVSYKSPAADHYRVCRGRRRIVFTAYFRARIDRCVSPVGLAPTTVDSRLCGPVAAARHENFVVRCAVWCHPSASSTTSVIESSDTSIV